MFCERECVHELYADTCACVRTCVRVDMCMHVLLYTYIRACTQFPRDESCRVARTIGCLVFICQLPQKSPIISGMIAGNAKQVFGWQRLQNCSFLQVVLHRSGNDFWSHLQKFRAG